MKIGTLWIGVLAIGFAGAIPAGAVGDAWAEAESLSGTVTDRHTGIPLAQIWIFISEKSNSRDQIRDSALTGPDGSYRFDGLHAITEIAFGYHILAKRELYKTYASKLIQVQSGEAKIHDVGLGKIIALRITVMDSASPGTPLAGAHIGMMYGRISAGYHFEPGYNALTGETDSMGHFRFKELRPGGTGLTLALKGYQTRYLRDSLEGKAFEESLTVYLSKEAEPAMTKTLLGVKRTASGKIVHGEQVHFTCPAPEGDYLLYDVLWKNPNPVADTGQFHLEAIPEGCSAGVLRTRSDSASVTLTGAETRVDFTIKNPPGLLSVTKLLPERAGPAVRKGLKTHTLLGRRKPVSPAAPGSGL